MGRAPTHRLSDRVSGLGDDAAIVSWDGASTCLPKNEPAVRDWCLVWRSGQTVTVTVVPLIRAT